MEGAPFLRWQGSARRLVPELMHCVPEEFGILYEPFLGSGALFFHLARIGRLRHGAFLSDANAELVNAFQQVRDRIHEVVPRVIAHVSLHSSRYFHEQRLLDRVEEFNRLTSVARAARFIYLANATFQGAWRVDRVGQLTSFPRTDQRQLDIPSEVLMECSAALRTASITTQDFRSATTTVSKGDLVFLDPPYLSGQSKTQAWRGVPGRFTSTDADDVVDGFCCLAERGATVVLCTDADRTVRALGHFRMIRPSKPRVPSEALIVTSSVSR